MWFNFRFWVQQTLKKLIMVTLSLKWLKRKAFERKKLLSRCIMVNVGSSWPTVWLKVRISRPTWKCNIKSLGLFVMDWKSSSHRYVYSVVETFLHQASSTYMMNYYMFWILCSSDIVRLEIEHIAAGKDRTCGSCLINPPPLSKDNIAKA